MHNLSQMRKTYIARLVMRGVIFILCVMIWIYRPEELNILEGNRFFQRLSLLHLLWGIWMVDMSCQLIPIKHHVPLGSQKLFRQRFQAAEGLKTAGELKAAEGLKAVGSLKVAEDLKVAGENDVSAALKQYMAKATNGACKVLFLWVLLIGSLGVLHKNGILGDGELFVVSVAFYVCDLICVLIWCPFRLIMKTRCCTTCRIFNWDHLMMFSPMIFVKGFYSRSLAAVAAVVWTIWEVSVFRHPERFWERTNTALKCGNCTDKLCTQYCGKH